MTHRTQPCPATDADARRCEEAWAEAEAEAVYREHEFRLSLRRTFGLPDDAVTEENYLRSEQC